MHYVIGDIHNDNYRLQKLLKQIDFSAEDQLYILGDLFDRCNYAPDPVGVYFTILKLKGQCTIIRGNHDQWLAEYIQKYYRLSEAKREKLEPYSYNSFQILRERLTPVDIRNMAKEIFSWPLQYELEVNDQKYLLAHAMTSDPENPRTDNYYLMGNGMDLHYLYGGIKGYVSLVGHNATTNNHIWKNEKGNLVMCDCGCGFRSGRLGCIRLEDMKEFYVEEL